MKLFIKRDISDICSMFIISDELGNEKYYSLNLKSKTNKTFVITDTQRNVLAKVRQIPFGGAKSFVFKIGKSHTTFVIAITSKGVYSNFYGNNWHINGEIASKNFSILDVDNTVIAINKNCGEYSELTVIDTANELYCIATSICINMINTVDKLVIQAV